MSSYIQRKKLIKTIILWAVIIGGFLALFIPTIVHGQTTGEVGKPINVCNSGLGTCLTGYDQFQGSDGISKFILSVVYFLVYCSAAISVLFIVLGGYKMISSNGSSEQYTSGLETLKGAVLGLVVAIVSFTIVSLVTALIPGISLQ